MLTMFISSLAVIVGAVIIAITTVDVRNLASEYRSETALLAVVTLSVGLAGAGIGYFASGATGIGTTLTATGSALLVLTLAIFGKRRGSRTAASQKSVVLHRPNNDRTLTGLTGVVTLTTTSQLLGEITYTDHFGRQVRAAALCDQSTFLPTGTLVHVTKVEGNILHVDAFPVVRAPQNGIAT